MTRFDREGLDHTDDLLVVALDPEKGLTILGSYEDADEAETFMDEFEEQWGFRPRLYQFIAF